jgi:hypothetical protein
MALNIPNIQPPVGGFLIGGLNTANALTKQNLANTRQALENQYFAPVTQSNINNMNAKTANQLLMNTDQPALNASEINNRNASANRINSLLPLESEKLKLQNQYYPGVTQAEINYKNMGGGQASTGAKDDIMFQALVGKDNPNLTSQQIYQASNILSQGGNTFPDGTPIVFSPASQRALDRSIRPTTTASLITKGVNANQAESELGVLSKYAQEGLEPYGNTFYNKSPQQIADTFKTDDESQKRLGKFVASQALQYEIAQNRIKLANGEPGVGSTQELMQLAKQNIDAKYPMMSWKARKETNRYIDEALREGLKARNKVGISTSSATGNKYSNQQNSKHDFSKMSDEELQRIANG